MKNVSFSENVCDTKITERKRIKRAKSIKKYKEQEAYDVGKRIHEQVKDEKKLDIRINTELFAENLLLHKNLHYLVHKVYRLSDESLIVLINKLLKN